MPDLSTGVPEPHGRDIAGPYKSIRSSIFILGVMDSGVDGVGETVDEHLPELWILQKSGCLRNGFLYGLRIKETFFRSGTPVRSPIEKVLPGIPDGRFRTHFKGEDSACFNIGKLDVGLCIKLSVQEDSLDIAVSVAGERRINSKSPAGDVDIGLPEDRRTEPESRAGRFHLVEAKGRQDVPGAHLPHILVSGKAVVAGAVLLREDLTYAVRRFPGLAQHYIEVSDVMTGFVPVDILADEAGHVRRRSRT